MRTRGTVPPRIARIVVFALTIGALFVVPVTAGMPIGPGVTYFPPVSTTQAATDPAAETISGISASFTAPQAVHVIRVARDNPYVELRASLGRERVAGLEPVLAQALRRHVPADAPREAVVAAVNADFFASVPVSGLPIGIHVQGGEIVTSPAGRPAFGVRRDGQPVIGVPELVAAVWRDGTPVETKYGNDAPEEAESFLRATIDAVNRTQNGLALTLYTPRFGAETPPVEGTVVTVRGIAEPLRQGAIHTGIVARTETFAPSSPGRATIPGDGVVFVSRDPELVMLDELSIGEWVHFSVRLAPPFADVVDAVAGWPILLREGERQSLPTGDSLVSGRHPRTAVGFNDDELIIVTVDGRRPGHAVGMTLSELTDLLISLGATDALNLDGGGSTTLVVRPPGETNPVVTNLPSDGHERSVANALLVLSTAPAAPLTTLHVRPAAPSVLRGATIPVAVLGQDRHNNPVTIPPEFVAWQWDTAGGSASPFGGGLGDFTFNSKSEVPHTAQLTATVGHVRGTATVNIVDSIAALQPATDIVNITAGETAALTLYAYDEAGRPVWIEPQQLEWSVSGEAVAAELALGADSPSTVGHAMTGGNVLRGGDASLTGVTVANTVASADTMSVRSPLASGDVGLSLANADVGISLANADVGMPLGSANAGTPVHFSASGDVGALTNSEQPTVATVDAFGRVTGQSAGQATVVARLGDVATVMDVFVDRPPLLIVDFSGPDARTEWFASVVRARAGLTRVPPPESLHPGRASLRLSYDLSVSPGGTAAAYLQASTPIPIPGRPEAIGVWVYGTGSGHWLRGNYIDGTGTRQVIDFTTVGGLDWTGWRLVTAPVPRDAVLPISMERIYVVEVQPERQTAGKLYFDSLVALYGRR